MSEDIHKNNSFEILGTKLLTEFSNNIRNNYGFLNSSSPEGVGKADKLFHQNGRKVFKEVIPKVSNLINDLSNNKVDGLIMAGVNPSYTLAENKKFNDITQQCFAFKPQVNFPANDLNFH